MTFLRKRRAQTREYFYYTQGSLAYRFGKVSSGRTYRAYRGDAARLAFASEYLDYTRSFVKLGKKKPEASKPDPDDDYDEDNGDELDIPEETLDEDDFDD